MQPSAASAASPTPSASSHADPGQTILDLVAHDNPEVSKLAIKVLDKFASQPAGEDALLRAFKLRPSAVIANAITSLKTFDRPDEVQACLLQGFAHVVQNLADAETSFTSASSDDADVYMDSLNRLILRKPLASLLSSVAILESLVLCRNDVFVWAKESRALFNRAQALLLDKERIQDCATALASLEPKLASASGTGQVYVSASLTVLEYMATVIDPTPFVPEFFMQLQRAATQEEYFRKNLSKNSVSSADIVKNAKEPIRIKDLRNKIAADLGMSDSAELFELLVAGKIMGPDLLLHRVYDTVWKPHCTKRKRTSSSAGFLADHMHDDDDDDDDDDDEDDMDEDDEFRIRHDDGVFALSGGGGGGGGSTSTQPMLVTYRLCAVDGEATEDFVSEIPDQVVQTSKENVVLHMGESGLVALIKIVQHCVNNLTAWPQARKLLDAALRALEKCTKDAPVNQKCLLLNGLLPSVLSAISFSGDVCLEILDHAITTSNAEILNQTTASGNEGSEEHLSWVLDQLAKQPDPRLVSALARLVPYLAITPSSAAKVAHQLCTALIPLNSQHSSAERAWMIQTVEALSTDSTVLRNQLLAQGLVQSVACVLQALGQIESHDEFVKHARQPEVLLALRLARGVLKNHEESQQCFCVTPGCVRAVIILEELSSTTVEGVGQAAEPILEILTSSSPSIKSHVDQEQKARVDAKRKLAMKHRENVNNKKRKQQSEAALSQVVHQQQQQKKWRDEFAMLKEESGLVCVVCQEGYHSRPNQVLSVYVYSKSAKLSSHSKFICSSGQIKPVSSSTWAVSSASSFVCIHPSCHDSAAKADKNNSKAPKDEWEGAKIRNGHVRCNNLLPLRGSASAPSYDAALQLYFDRVDRDTKAQVALGGSSLFSFCAHDLRYLLLRASFGENLSEDTNGGGLESNLKLIVPLLQMGMYMLDGDKNQRVSAESLWTLLCESDDAQDACFAAVMGLFLKRSDAWDTHRANIAKRLRAQSVRHEDAAQGGDATCIGSGTCSMDAESMTQRARSRSRARSLSLGDAQGLDDFIPKTHRPFWVFFGLVETLHRMRAPWLVSEDEFAACEVIGTKLADACRTLQSSSSSISSLKTILGSDLSYS